MAKLVIYDLNLQLCDDYQIKKELCNTIVLSSEDEEELIVDKGEDDTFEDYSICPNYSQNYNLGHPSTNTATAPNLTMKLRRRKNMKSLAHLDLMINTSLDSESYALEDDLSQELSNRSSDNLSLIKREDDEFEDIDVGTDDLPQQNIKSMETPFVESNSFNYLNTTSRLGSSKYSKITSNKTLKRRKLNTTTTDDSDSDPQLRRATHNLKECLRRQHLNNLFDRLKHIIPIVETRNICSRNRILNEATITCHALQNEQIFFENLKVVQKQINVQLREELKNLILETIF